MRSARRESAANGNHSGRENRPSRRAVSSVGREDDEHRAKTANADEVSAGEVLLKTRRHDLRGRTPNQRAYLQAILSHDISFGIGPAGTGKTYLAVAAAVDAFERGTVERIVLTRPAVEAGEHLGFLPGDLSQKVAAALRCTF